MKKIESSTFCSLLWNHQFIDPSGRIKPCCRFIDSAKPKDFHLKHMTSSEAFRSEFLDDLRKMSSSNQKISGCQRCYEEEDNGKRSLRQRYNSRSFYTQNIDSESPKIEWLEISFSNTCNLACRMCDSRYSSLWVKQNAQLGKPTSEEFEIDAISRLDMDLGSIRHVKFTGGEPLMDHRHMDFLKRLVSTQKSHQMNLNYSTNGSFFPDQELLDLWSKFEFVELVFSVDSCVDVELNYIRWPLSLNKLEKNLAKYKELQSTLDVRIGCRPTITILNIWNIHKIYEWWEKFQFLNTWINPTHLTHPEWLSLQVLPNPIKRRIEMHLKEVIRNSHNHVIEQDLNYLIKYMNEKDQTVKWEQTGVELKRIDDLRGQNFKKIYQDQYFFSEGF